MCRVEIEETSQINFDFDAFPTLILGLPGVRSVVQALRPQGDPWNIPFLEKLEDILLRPVRRNEEVHEDQPVLEYDLE